MNPKCKYIFLLLITIGYTSIGQSFREVNSNIEGVAFGKVDWADGDNDGDLDVLMVGLKKDNVKTSELRLNIGSLLFPELPLKLNGLFRGDCKWGDLNNDGLNDFIISGIDNDFKPRTFVYFNSGENNFTFHKELIGIANGKIVIDDFNADGKNDILLIGKTNRKREAILYFKTASGFQINYINLKSVSHPAIAAFNLNGDSLPDLIVSGRNSNFKRITKVFINKNNGVFEPINPFSFSFSKASISVKDIDKNGYDDVLISGSTSKGLKTILYMNNNGILQPSPAQINGVSRGSNSFIDFDNDGDYDILVSGLTSDKPITELYVNDKNSFLKSSEGFTGLYDSSLSVGDFDGDKDTDFIVNGRTVNNNYLCIIYKNELIKMQ